MTRFYFICFCLFLIGCEKEIRNSQSDYEAYVVVNSIISTDSTFSVKLNYSKSIYDTGDFKPVEDAYVSITVKEDIDDTRTQDFRLDYEGDGLYTRGNNPIEGRNYEMVIEVDGETITAETYVPRVLKAEVVNKSSQRDPDTKKTSITVDIAIEEEVSEEQNYYAWELSPIQAAPDTVTVNERIDETDKSLPIDENGNFINPNPSSSSSPGGEKSDGLSGAVPALTDGSGKITAVFEDKTSGQETIGNQGGSGNNSNTSPTFSSGQKYKLKVWAISYDYYHYLLSIQHNSIGNSDSHFLGPYSNVTNGSGIFAGYNLKEIEVEF